MRGPGRRDMHQLISAYGAPFSQEMGIDPGSCRNDEILKWFLASILFGARISEKIAKNTYAGFVKHGVLAPGKIIAIGFDGLVGILDAGGYARYDFKTADKLLAVSGALQERYGGDLNRLHDKASSPGDLEARLMALGKGIGATTVSIFLREMRGCWKKADPAPTRYVLEAMKNLGITDLKAYARTHDIDIMRLEAALFRIGRDFCRKRKCPVCPAKGVCSIAVR